MALGTMTRAAAQSGHTGDKLFYDRVSFLGDDSYPTGGTTGFDALLQALLGDARAVVGVEMEDCGGFTPVYLPANGGTLKVYRTGAINVAQEEVPNTTDLSATTFNVLVISR